MQKILIKNACLIDGTGAPQRETNLLIGNGIIEHIGSANGLLADQTIDAAGRVATPGFIDAHCHGDVLNEPEFENFLAMGVTTICLGQDGTSPSSNSLGHWFNAVEEIKPGVNVLTLTGHGTLREHAGIGYERHPGPVQIMAMQTVLSETMRQGSFGLSTGLEYLPGLYAELSELAALASTIGENHGILMSHMRSEDDDKIDAAIAELAEQGRMGHAHVHISHLKVTYGKGEERAREILALIDRFRKDGINLTADIYPYEASCTTIGIIFPEFAKAPHDYQEAVRTRRDDLAAYIQNRVEARNGPDATLFTTGPYAGKTLGQAAAQAGKPFTDLLIDEVGPDGADAAYFVMDEDLQARLMTGPGIVFSSDGSPTMGHPRGYGAFPRVIERYVLEKKLLPLEEAVWKMTGLTAETLGLAGQRRGILREGCAADLLLFDPARVRATADYRNPHQLAEGIDTVIVNGTIVREEGSFTGQRAGRALRKTCSTSSAPRGTLA